MEPLANRAIEDLPRVGSMFRLNVAIFLSDEQLRLLGDLAVRQALTREAYARSVVEEHLAAVGKALEIANPSA